MNQSITNSALHELRNRVVAKGNASAINRYITKGKGAILTNAESELARDLVQEVLSIIPQLKTIS